MEGESVRRGGGVREEGKSVREFLCTKLVCVHMRAHVRSHLNVHVCSYVCTHPRSPGDHCLLKTGYGALADALAQGLDIRLGTQVCIC